MRRFNNLQEAINDSLYHLLNDGKPEQGNFWQGKEITDEKMKPYEITNLAFTAQIPNSLYELHGQVKPNLPWAENHFLERVGGEPLNPGEQYKHWPFYKSDEFRTEQGKFTHTYMERFWPKFAEVPMGKTFGVPRNGIRYPYGDLDSVISLLVKDPYTRQAYLPIWFPEDTGAVHGGRVPCTLGYHFMMRDNRLHIFYDIRSCDALRHFRDDIYLACRLNLWILAPLRALDPDGWNQVEPGDLTMHIYSFHIFQGDIPILRMREKQIVKVRPTREAVLFQVASLFAQRSTCTKPNASVIARDGTIISIGYNGSPPGQAHCTDHGCQPGPDGGCIRTIHAEANAIAMAAKSGIPVAGASIYCTTSPCHACAKLIISSGISSVYYIKEYRDLTGVNLLKDSGREVLAQSEMI